MTNDRNNLLSLVEAGFGHPHVLVVGDLMVDKYVWGEVERISPEAPVPVLRAGRHSQQPGGAANVAMNLAGLGARVTVMGFAGGDSDQQALEAMLGATDVNFSIVTCPGTPTTSKLRVMAGQQQLLRMDCEAKPANTYAAAEELLEHALAVLPQVSVVVLSDYAKGVLSDRVCHTLVGDARRLRVPVVVDPKGNDFSRYRGATAVCPNAKELAAVTGESAGDLKRLLAAGQTMTSGFGLDYMLVTLGEKGIAILRADSQVHVPAAARQVYDVSGAGDTVVAVLAAALASGAAVEEATRLANLAAGIVIGKVGTVPIRRAELLGALAEDLQPGSQEKVLSLDLLLARVADWRARGLQVAFMNGCFDLLHAGHIALLEQARRRGDRLIVALNGDRSVRRLKGIERPLVCQQDRARILAALQVVDAVVLFDESTPLHLIEALRPDVLVKGGDYCEEEVAGAAEVRGWGGRIELVPLVAGCSTTNLIKRSGTLTSAGS
jgi:D-beta-D-heptose 7-phosphate kinase/D-beta-D-heptose 1-phosphate adenosyltransferase